MTSLKTNIFALYNSIKPFKDIIWFLFLFIFFDFLWKLCVDEGENHDLFILLGTDYTKQIEPISIWTAKLVHWTVSNIFGYENFQINGSIVYFENSLKLKMVWGCTGIKQMIMFAFVIMFYFGPFVKKLWFVPISLLLLFIANILRIVVIVFITKNGFPHWFVNFNEWNNNKVWDNTVETYWEFYVDWFRLFHEDVLGWLYYIGVVFVLWLIWQEKINLPYQKKKIVKEEKK